MQSFGFLLAQNDKITNWLTPVWMIAIGISIGFILVFLMMITIYLFSKIRFLNTVVDKPVLHKILGAVVGLAGVGLFVAFYVWRFPPLDSEVIFPLLFAVPISLLLGWGGFVLISKRGSTEAFHLFFREGFLKWINIVCLSMIGFAAIGFLLAPFNGFGVVKFVDDPIGMMNSLTRMPVLGLVEKSFEVEPSDENHSGDPIAVDFYGQEALRLIIDSNQRLECAFEPITPLSMKSRIINVAPNLSGPTLISKYNDQGRLIPPKKLDTLYVVNLGGATAKVTFIYQTGPLYSQVWAIPWAASFVVFLYWIYLVLAVSYPKVSAIALSTFKTEISQPLFGLVLIIGGIFIVGSIYIPYNTFGEDIKMYKDSGLTLIRVMAIFLAIWAASKSVAEEIEGRTALTVLSKPVGRRQFIFGKFSGITLALAALFIVLGIWFVIWTAYKPIYDAVEMSRGREEWDVCFREAVFVVPALFLNFLEVTLFVAISVAISTRFGILANFLICFAIYVLGHLTPLIVASQAAQAFEPVVLFGQVISIIFPVLDHFDVQAAINTNQLVPMVYLGWAVIYTGLYGTMAMLLALVLFEDRDLA